MDTVTLPQAAAAPAPRAPDLAIVMHDLRGGGAERVSLTLAAGLTQTGRQVELVLAQDYGALRADVPEGVGAEILDAPRVAAAIPAIARYLRTRRPRAVLAVMTHVNIATIAAAKLAGYRGLLAVAEHNTFSVKRRSARGATKLNYAAAPFAYRFADKVITVSRAAADDFARAANFPRERVDVIYNPVIDDQLAARAAAPIAHPWFASGPPVIVAVGRLHRQKGFDDLIRAFALLRQERPARLMILGEGEQRPNLEKLAQHSGFADDIALPGFVRNPYPYLSRAALFVLSSRWEGLPTVLIEALACGAAVVSTDCPHGPREILDDGRYGRLVPPGDIPALRDAMAKSLARSKRFSVETFTPLYGVDAAVARYAAVLEL